MSAEPRKIRLCRDLANIVSSKMLGGFATFLITQRSGTSFTKPKRSDQIVQQSFVRVVNGRSERANLRREKGYVFVTKRTSSRPFSCLADLAESGQRPSTPVHWAPNRCALPCANAISRQMLRPKPEPTTSKVR